ncbi:hypothetical protein CAPTEDRAFT_221118 [Capitella teleta]|uniref:Sfi1 spindle body domain-containing protein n=1 Tax=Capitella teleta TaxID=283909 RepID=R7U992_CAPTE|nr:hypothetical protein CAPTEDRAFT_221118 [Capitella teleta]|eukprot:ELU00378.1 hypothetical protein CAPTEDRAFT_221118 [Capitella teleta]
MSSGMKDLYKWERVSKPRVYSRSQRIASKNDIEDWVQKVEDASGMAAAATFGQPYMSKSRMGGHKQAKERIIDTHIHEAAYVEAQDLLQQWVEEKIHIDHESDYYEDPRKTKAEIRRDWDHLLDMNTDDDGDDDMELKSAAALKKKRDILVDEEEDVLVDAVMKNMLDKDLAEEDPSWRRLCDDEESRRTDPRMKMELRRQLVKENRAKREKERIEKKKEKLRKKETQFHARQIVKKEEQVKASRAKQEEHQIQMEMAKIRKEMEEERKQKQEAVRRRKAEEEAERRELELDVEEEDERQGEVMEAARQQMAQEREKALQRMQFIRVQNATQDLKLLQSHFSAWYRVVLERRLQHGKAQAMADWKLLLRSFNAWKHWTRSQTVERDASAHQMRLLQDQRKRVVAESHYQRSLMRRAMGAWLLFVKQQQAAKSLHQDQLQTKTKMAAFLDAASKGKLSNAKADEVQDNTKVEGMFTKDKRPSPIEETTDRSSARSPSRTGRNRSEGTQQPPLQAWQLTKKHAQVSKEELEKVSERQPQRVVQMNCMQHRHAAQQKILHQQQQQLKEQQRLIQEMQYLQQQQLLQQQLVAGQPPGPAAQSPGSAAQLLGSAAQPPGSAAKLPDAFPLEETEIVDTERSESTLTTVSQMTTERSDMTTSSQMTSQRPSSARQPVKTDPKHMHFLKSMEERAAERARIKQEREEKRRKLEQEKWEKLQAEEEEKMQELEADRRRKAEAYKEKKRLLQQKEEEKQHLQKRLAELTIVADEHRKKALLKYRGWKPWQRLIEMAHQREERAMEHARCTLLRKVLLSWHRSTEEDLQVKRRKADQMAEFILVRRCFNNLKRIGQQAVILEEKAVRFHAHKVLSACINAWADWAAEEKVNGWRKERVAKEHSVIRIQKNCLLAWKRFPVLIREEEMKEERRAEMRKKVASMLPDYSFNPPGS